MRTQINGLRDLGLVVNRRRASFLKSSELALLVNYRWLHPTDVEEQLKRVFLLPGENLAKEENGIFSDGPRRFTREEIEKLQGESVYNRSLIWKKIRDVGAEFLEAIFDKQPKRRDSLANLVALETFKEIPLFTFDPHFRILQRGERRWMQVHLTVRLFHLEVQDGDLSGGTGRWVKRCEMLFEDRALGSVPMDSEAIGAGELGKAVRACLIDALRSKIALSLVENGLIHSELLRPHSDLLGLSLSDVESPRQDAAGGGRERGTIQ